MGFNLTEKPLKAISEITVTDTVLHQVINFYYHDPDEYYRSIKDILTSEENSPEFEEIIENMQSYLDEDEVLVNSHEIFLDIIEAYISYPPQNSYFNPLLTFEIKSSSYSLINGLNRIELYGDKQIAPYPINIKWTLPGKVFTVNSESEKKLVGNKILFSTNQNDFIGGYELIEFLFPM